MRVSYAIALCYAIKQLVVASGLKVSISGCVRRAMPFSWVVMLPRKPRLLGVTVAL